MSWFEDPRGEWTVRCCLMMYKIDITIQVSKVIYFMSFVAN